MLPVNLFVLLNLRIFNRYNWFLPKNMGSSLEIHCFSASKKQLAKTSYDLQIKPNGNVCVYFIQ